MLLPSTTVLMYIDASTLSSTHTKSQPFDKDQYCMGYSPSSLRKASMEEWPLWPTSIGSQKSSSAPYNFMALFSPAGSLFYRIHHFGSPESFLTPGSTFVGPHDAHKEEGSATGHPISRPDRGNFCLGRPCHQACII